MPFPHPESPSLPLEALAAHDDLAAIDVEMARLMRRLGDSRDAGDSNAVIEQSALLLSARRRAGASCVRLADWAGRPFPEEASDPSARRVADPDAPEHGPRLPPVADWQRRLESSPLVAEASANDAADPAPIVLSAGSDGSARLYFYRWWRAERTVARLLHRRVAAADPPPLAEKTRAAFERFFGKTSGAEPASGQAVAAAGALFSPLTVVVGGPGTGKTYAAARLVALLLTASGPGQRVALAAPTGKAAKRLSASIARETAALDLSEEVRAAMPTEAQTLHRLLGYRPRENRFRYGPGRQLDVDAVVVDESSMVDLLMLKALLEALPEHARVVLLGDAHQLASIAAGRVLADLAALRGTGRTPAFARYGRQIGAGRQPVAGGGPPLRDAVVRLTKNHRFGADSGLAALAEAVRRGEADRAMGILNGNAHPEVQLASPPEGLGAVHHRGHDVRPLGEAVEHARALCRASSAEAALAQKERVQMLAATHHGSRGVRAANAFVEDALRESGDRGAGRFWPGRLVLVTENDYEQALFNGDLGVCVTEGGQLRACFDGAGAGEEEALRAVAPARLPACESAYAITVHKSQGSEYGEVILLLPDEMQPPLCRELVYTAVTRARERVTVVGPEAVLRKALRTPERRPSGLREAIRSA